MAATASQEWITEMQLRLGREWATTLIVEHVSATGVVTYRTVPAPKLHSAYRHNWRRSARWWELEAMRGYTGPRDEHGLDSSQRSRMYAANLRWLVELLDNGVRVIGRHFDDIVKERTGLGFDKFRAIQAAAILERHP